MRQATLEFDVPVEESADARARRLAIDPSRNVALEASAGTGKTRVLVDRYISLLVAGVEPRQILAMTFTRKAAAEMRRRILQELARRITAGEVPATVVSRLQEARGEITIATIDAFCLSLLREFPLEADLDPGFALADETDTPRLVETALDRTLGIARALALEDADLALLFADLGEFRLRAGLAALLERRLLAGEGLARFVRRADVSVDAAVRRVRARLRAAFVASGGLHAFLAHGPDTLAFCLLAGDLQALCAEEGTPELPKAGAEEQGSSITSETIQAWLERPRSYFLTQEGKPRRGLAARTTEFRSRADYLAHKAALLAAAPFVADALDGLGADLNLILARGVRRLFAIAEQEYRRTLAHENVLDFSEVLARTLSLLRQMDEFSRSRFRLESRYQHVLVDEFQDTSWPQWQLVELLIRAWGEGEGTAAGALLPTVFVVGDRKQSIYGFRDAEASVLEQAARYIGALRPAGDVRHAITRSFRSVPALLAFFNDLFTAIDKQPDQEAFRYDSRDAFPLEPVSRALASEPVLGLAAASSDAAQAAAVCDEIARLLESRATVRDPQTGLYRAIVPADIAILFRTREGHRRFADALAQRQVPFYVYKGLGFFEADEVQDVLATIAWLAAPSMPLRVAAFLRSRVVGLSDPGLKVLASSLGDVLTSSVEPERLASLHADDAARLELARSGAAQWLALADRVTPSELLDRVLADVAYAAELRGPGARQAEENLKKIRALVRRLQNRGYTTLQRISAQLAEMSAGADESNALIDAADAVSLMTVHAAKGLEFPVVFLVNLGRGSGGSPDPIRVSVTPFEPDAEVEVSVGSYESTRDRMAGQRETEEAKRLLYVAATRARDRLYLGATIGADGVLQPQRNSLARVLPPTVAALFAEAALPGADDLVWQGSAHPHRFRRLVAQPEPVICAHRQQNSPADVITDFAALSATSRQVAVTEWIEERGTEAPVNREQAPTTLSTDERYVLALAGSLVHRAVQVRLGHEAPLVDRDLGTALEALIDDEERVVPNAIARAVALATGTYRALLERDEVRAAMQEASFEVALSTMPVRGVTVRGSIDALASAPGGGLTVIEVKTGNPRSSHQQQMAIYVAAVRGACAADAVTGWLLSPD